MLDTTPSEHPSSPEGALSGLPKTAGLKDFSLKVESNSSKFDLNLMDQAQLLAVRAQIDAKLTGISLSDVDLVKETLIQFQYAKVLQADASKEDSGVPMNQRAQVQNSIAALLRDLAKTQADLHSSESLKRLKTAVIKCVKTLPKEAQETFFEILEEEFTAVEAQMEA